jgi:pimeloyl-ACP methyl ester carboxylesterase
MQISVRRNLLSFSLAVVVVTMYGQQEQPVTLETASGNIQGTLLTPNSTDAIPVALIIAGSGPTDRDGNNPMMKNNSLKMLAEALADHGVATVRYDKRGVAGSAAAAIAEADLRFEHFVDDARAWVRMLAGDERFSEIQVLGHSEGALIALLVAQDDAVSKCISIAGAGMSANNLIREQLTAQPMVIIEKANPILETLERGDTTHNVPPILMSLFRPDIQPYLISWFAYNPRQEIEKLDKPVLIIQGSTDIQAGVPDARLLADAQPRAQLEIIYGMNHVLKEAPDERMLNLATYSEPDRPLADGLIEPIVNFIIGD